MSGILGIAYGHIHCRLVVSCLPSSVEYLDDSSQWSVGDDTLGAASYWVYHRRLLTVPASEGTKSEGVAYPQHVVAITLCLLFLGGIKLCCFQFQTFLEFSVEVEGLTLVEIDAYTIELSKSTP